ncbi:sulfate adenylyltransferase subunit CysN [uncultured Paludibaculum sp.]|uniref:sulfate adenylyltransferase subunit CysN n=1 Tax=uncultured Paludibaculum sp. TaxID=1765020 RepID=UPI002AAAB7B2|nr:sulfate adenylyltransferase subunit CysN [uncultured Paludibaculum sp.]
MASPSEAQIGIDQFLRREEEKDLLRFITAGSVDDGKSTLIGRLLYDSKGVYEDQITSIRKATVNETAGTLDFALLTDGLRAEREQGITIDVAYRYFATPKRKFIIADTPGHEQYTRNMATGASTANLAIVLIDARNGVLPQSRRHAFIASLLGIHHVVVAVNKMDLMGYSEEVFHRIRADFSSFAAQLNIPDLYFIPVSALLGDNIVTKSDHMPWFEGASLLHHLETVHIASDRNLSEMRFPVQLVLRPNQQFRGYAGQVASGVLRPGDPVMVLPSGRTSRVKSIVTYDGEVTRAFPPMSVTVSLEDDVDVSRGNMFAPPSHPPHVTRCIDARLVWMGDQPLDLRRQYIIKHTTQSVKAQVRFIRYRVNVNTLEKLPAPELRLNEIGTVVIDTHAPLFVDQYRRNRATGSFVLVDPVSNATVAAGMVTGRDPRVADPTMPDAPLSEENRVPETDRQQRIGHPSALIWMNGGASIGFAVERELFQRGYLTHVIAAQTDGSVLLELAHNLTAAGLITICAADFLYEVERERAGALIDSDRFLDVDVTVFGTSDEAAMAIAEKLTARGITPRKP